MAGQGDLMKALTRFWQVIAIGAIIAAGLSACITISSAPPETEEELALRDTMENASWNAQRLTNPPSLNGFEKISKTGYTESEWAIEVETSSIVRLATGGEESRGRTIKATGRNGVERTITLIGLDDDVWYALTAPELPGITYYYYKSLPNSMGVSNREIYKGGQ